MQWILSRIFSRWMEIMTPTRRIDGKISHREKTPTRRRRRRRYFHHSFTRPRYSDSNTSDDSGMWDGKVCGLFNISMCLTYCFSFDKFVLYVCTDYTIIESVYSKHLLAYILYNLPLNAICKTHKKWQTNLNNINRTFWFWKWIYPVLNACSVYTSHHTRTCCIILSERILTFPSQLYS